jgi:hypothetical protein
MVTTYDAFVVNLRNIAIQIKNNYCRIEIVFEIIAYIGYKRLSDNKTLANHRWYSSDTCWVNLGEWSPFAGAQMDHQAYFLFEDMQPRSTLLRFDY